MKTFYDIIKMVSNMRWSIDDPEPSSFTEVQMNLKQAIQQAHSYIWGRDDFPFKQVKELAILSEGQDSLPAPAGNIINIMVNGSKDYLQYEASNDFLEAKSGLPERFWIEAYNSGSILKFYPRADKNYYIQQRYNTLYKARNNKGDLIFNLEAIDDVLNLPKIYEESYLAALKPMAIYYLIADNTDENFQPYKEQFEQQYAILKNMTGINIETRFIL